MRSTGFLLFSLCMESQGRVWRHWYKMEMGRCQGHAPDGSYTLWPQSLLAGGSPETHSIWKWACGHVDEIPFPGWFPLCSNSGGMSSILEGQVRNWERDVLCRSVSGRCSVLNMLSCCASVTSCVRVGYDRWVPKISCCSSEKIASVTSRSPH